MKRDEKRGDKSKQGGKGKMVKRRGEEERKEESVGEETRGGGRETRRGDKGKGDKKADK